MPLQDELCFVQFIHPGKEHRPDHDGYMDWNRADHKRKFLEIEGHCVRRGKKYSGPVQFWGEWEPQSEVIAPVEAAIPDGPRCIQRPFYVVPPSYRGRQNTDPFVFDGFVYAVCKQNTKKGPTQLRYLKQGSVILFGSYVRGHFAIDTVFVVDNWIEFPLKTAVKSLSDSVSEAYMEAVVKTWNQPLPSENACGPDKAKQSFRLYSGATIDKRVNGMFSFFPCQPASESKNGFARPVIKMPNIITDSLLMGQRLNRGISPKNIPKLWQQVCDAVESAGQWLGVNAEMPMRRKATPPVS